MGCPVPSSSKGTIRCTDLGFVSYQALFLTKEPTCSLAATVLAYKTCVLKRASRENAVVRATENPAARSAPPSVGKCGRFFFWAPDLFCCKFMKNTMNTMKLQENKWKYMIIHENTWKLSKYIVLIQNTLQKHYKIGKIHANTWKYITKYNIILVFSILS